MVFLWFAVYLSCLEQQWYPVVHRLDIAMHTVLVNEFYKCILAGYYMSNSEPCEIMHTVLIKPFSEDYSLIL